MRFLSDITDKSGRNSTEQAETFTVDGTLVTGTGAARLSFPWNVTILGVSAAVATAPTSASIIVDVNKNGTTIFTTQANRPSIAATQNRATETTPDVTSLTAFTDYLTVDVDQIGSGTPGADLTVCVRYRRA